jgi:ribosomal-protein-serine acetyltransferase
LKKSHPSVEIKAERITLKRHSLELAAEMFAAVEKDRERLRRFLPWVDQTKKLEDEQGFIQMTLDKWETFEHFDFGLFRKSDGAYLGNIGVHRLEWGDQRCELGYWIFGAHEGQGFMAEAVRALEQELFGMGFNRIEICCSSLNLRSAGVPRRCGYHLDGVMRQDGIENGKFRDTMVFSKLRSEFLAQAAQR